jgi:hypothetical protein
VRLRLRAARGRGGVNVDEPRRDAVDGHALGRVRRGRVAVERCLFFG